MRLLESADAFVHNMRPQAIDRLGLDYRAVSARNPSIVYCGAWGFRRSGPYGHKPAYDDMIQAVSGLAALQAVDGEPRYVTSVVADKVTGLHVAVAVLAALLHRARTGEGQCIEVPMFETLVGFNMFEHLYGKTYEPPRGSMGYPRALSPDRRPYRTRDGWVGALPYTDRQWAALFEIAQPAGSCRGPAVRDPAEPPRAHRRGLRDARRAAGRAHHRRVARSVRRREHSVHAGQSTRTISSRIPISPRPASGRHWSIRIWGRCASRMSRRGSRRLPAQSAAPRRGSANTAWRCSARSATSGPRSMRSSRRGSPRTDHGAADRGPTAWARTSKPSPTVRRVMPAALARGRFRNCQRVEYSPGARGRRPSRRGSEPRQAPRSVQRPIMDSRATCGPRQGQRGGLCESSGGSR